MYSNLKSSFITNSGIEYLDTEINSEKPVICILHGLFGSLSNFEVVINQLKSDFRIVVPSLPLFESDGFQSITEISDAVHSFLKQLNISNPFHLIGNSLGGQIALHFAHKHPQLVLSLILTGSAGLQENTFGFSKPRRFCREYVVDRSKEVFHSFELDDVSINEISDVLSTPSKLRRLLRLARSSKSASVQHILHLIQAPTLLIWGKNDEITTPDSALEFYHSLPNATLKWIQQCGHAPMMEHPLVFSKTCSEFYSTLKSSYKESKEDYVKTYHTF